MLELPKQTPKEYSAEFVENLVALIDDRIKQALEEHTRNVHDAKPKKKQPRRKK